MASGWAKQRWAGLLGLALLFAGCPWITGCEGFFVCDKASCTNGGSGTATASGDYAYVANATKGSQYIGGYELSTGTPIALSNSPYSLGFVPTAMVVAPGNGLMFIASGTSPYGIYAYTIASNGNLTIANSGTAVAPDAASAMDISPDGKYLFVLSTNTISTTVTEYNVTNASGVLSVAATLPSGLIGGNAAAIKVAPSHNFAVMSLGTAGDEVMPLTNGLLTSAAPSYVSFTQSGIGDFAVTVDSSNNIFFARTGQVAVYAATSAGALTAVNNATANSTAGAGDHSIVLSSKGAYLYTGNANATTLSGFSNSNGTLGNLTGSPYAGPASVASVGVDNSGKYLLAAGYNSGGLIEYAIGSAGALTASSTKIDMGSSVTPVMALTH